MVARDNFGPNVAQVAAVALLIDYTVTVAVQTSAGTAALSSVFPALRPTLITIAITVGVTLIMLYGNLRGIREAGSIFAIPTYFYVVSLSLVVITGLVKGVLGGLHAHALPSAAALGYPIGNQRGFLMGLGIFYCLRAFANGGSSLTGLEAVSNGISSFRKPEARNGRIALADHVRHPRIPGAGDVVARALDPRRSVCEWQPDGGLAGGAVRPRQHVGGHRALLSRAGGDGDDPLHRWQHELQRIPVPGELRRR